MKKTNLSGIYRTSWEWRKESYEALAVIFRFADNTISGLEICTDTNIKNGGIYFLKGSITKRMIIGQWEKSDNSQRGRFRLVISPNHKQWQGRYNISIKSTKYPYIYTFNYLRGLK